jgi:YgiT-type zinc finger domain-containing protein
VVRVVEDVVLKIRGRVHRFENVAHERCEKCGEQVFDLETSRRFDAVLRTRGKKHAA